MKKLIAVLILMVSTSGIVMGAQTQTMTESTVQLSNSLRVTTLSWTADSTATFSKVTAKVFRGQIYQIETKPDTSLVPADSTGRKPADNYDIAVKNAWGTNLLGSTLANRDSTDAELAIPLTAGNVPEILYVHSKLTITITNLTRGSVRGYLRIFWREE